MAALAVPALVHAAPPTIPRLGAIRLDAQVLVVAAGATVLAALLFGLVPAVRYTRRAALGAVRKGGRSATADRTRHRGRRLLVALQTALTLVLLVGSGLFIRSFARMLDADMGFTPADVLTLRVTLPQSGYPNLPHVLDFERRLIERLGALPGIEVASAVSGLPMATPASGTAFTIDGRPTPPGELPPLIRYKAAAPGYFEAMGIRLLAGRTFDERDLSPESREILVNKAAADAFWPGEDAIGKRLRPASGPPDLWFTIAGVVASERQDGFRRDPPLLIYWGLGAAAPFQSGSRQLNYVLRGPNATGSVSAVREAVRALDPRLPVSAVMTMDEIVSRSIVAFTFTMLSLGVAAAMALVLGMVGLYGVLSYTVTLRVREIGVRLALGAAPSRVLRAIVGEGLLIAAIGLVAGIIGAVGLTRLVATMLYGTRPLDALTFVTTSAGLLAVAAVASYLPARRAAAVSPMESLRLE
jgi:predicted permease